MHEGMDCNVLYFQRAYYPGPKLPCNEVQVGSMEHGRYLSRIPALIRAIPKARRHARGTDVLYAFGLDQALLAIVVRSLIRGPVPLVVYEVGDVRELFLRRTIMAKVARWLDRWTLKSVDLLVTTSEGFVKGYYCGVLQTDPDPYMIVENKVDPSTFPAPDRGNGAEGTSRIVIGYFGVLRSPNSWTALKRIAALAPDRFAIYLAGINKGLEGLEETVENEGNFEFHGPYVAPEELSNLYGQVDLVWAPYYKDGQVENWRWARTNRFYEACFYGVPLVAQKETPSAEVVEKYGTGIVVDLRNPVAAAERIAEIDPSDINRWRRNITQMPEALYQQTDEHRGLIRRLRVLATGDELPAER